MWNHSLLIISLVTSLFYQGGLGAQSSENELSVLFDVGSNVITQQADSAFRKFIRELKLDGKFTRDGYVLTRNGIDHIDIVAHTDAVGKLKYNELLSKRRAESVRDWLADHQIDSSLCILSWKGEVDSLVSNSSEPQRQLNRRALIKVYVNAYYITPMHLVEGTVLDSNDAGIDAKIVLTGKWFIDSTRTDSAGYFSLQAPDTTVLSIDVFAKGYVYTSRMFKNDRRRIVGLNFKPAPLQRGVKFQLQRFYFVGNQAVLLKSSKPELARLMRFMTLNPTTIISIEGHINFPNNPRVSMESNQYDLSERRAKLVYDYLVEQKINPQRMSYEGFGNWDMIYPKARTEDRQSKNRRVEIRIVEQ